jgi:LysR family glycine cleavage system transcriptional activator
MDLSFGPEGCGVDLPPGRAHDKATSDHELISFWNESMRRRFLPSTGELVAFECAGRHGSFTRAAEELSLSQSAISRQISTLEDRVGAALFQRVRQRVVLTAAGRLYLAEVRRILERMGEATHQAMSQGGAEAILNIAVLPTFGARWLAPRLVQFAALHPQITVNLASRLKPFDFAEEGFDAAIHFGAPAWPEASLRLLMEERTVPLCSPALRQARGVATPADLVGLPLLHQSTRPTAWLDWFDLVGVETPQGVRGPTYDQFGMALAAATAGMGVALAPRFLAERELSAGQLEVLFERSSPADGSYYFAVPESSASDPAVRRFGDWITAEAAHAAGGARRS